MDEHQHNQMTRKDHTTQARNCLAVQETIRMSRTRTLPLLILLALDAGLETESATMEVRSKTLDANWRKKTASVEL